MAAEESNYGNGGWTLFFTLQYEHLSSVDTAQTRCHECDVVKYESFCVES